jgi:hypothetical protein
MSLFPAYFGARKRPDEETAPAPEPEDESRADVFNLIPPRASDKYERPKGSETPSKTEVIDPPARAEGRGIHPATAMDLTRLSIDNDGRLYWDGKPVEVRRRLMMSQQQVVGAGIIAFFIVVAAIGSAIQATSTLSNWACRSGITQCDVPTAPAPKPRLEIPA